MVVVLLLGFHIYTDSEHFYRLITSESGAVPSMPALN